MGRPLSCGSLKKVGLPALTAGAREVTKVLPLPHLRFENLLLGSEPVLFVVADFTTTAFIEFVGSRPYCVLCWDSVWHHRQVGGRLLRVAESLGYRLFVRIGIDHGLPVGAWTKRNVLQMG